MLRATGDSDATVGDSEGASSVAAGVFALVYAQTAARAVTGIRRGAVAIDAA
ncbi:hypothetical protein AB0H00_11180 [Nocardia sp. NPDC023852]|uniref:hypothetical protein n=1 Tax=Nocardia sp. NPDC023852 TaxID=3154697 RepID=UPI0033EB35DC